MAATAGPAAKRAAFVLPAITKDTVCDDSPVPAEMPVAQPATLAAPESSFTVWSAPLVKEGASFTPVIVIVNVWSADVSAPPLAVPPSSWAATVIVADPEALAAGVKVSVPLAATAGPAAKRAAFVLPVMAKVTDWPASSAGPALTPVAQPAVVAAPESSSTVGSAPFVNDGASLTAVTVMVNVCSPELSVPPLAVPPSSAIRSVIVAEPLALAAGVKVSVPLAATAGPAAKRAAFVLPVTVKPTVWADSPVPALIPVAQPATDAAPESSLTVWFAPLVNAGASFTPVTVMVNVWPADVLAPPLAVPPSSWAATVMVAEPAASAAGVKVSVPSAATAGPAAKRPAFVLPVIANDTDCADSSAGPAEIAVAHPATVAAPESSSTVWSAPFVKEGASLTAVTAIVNVCSPEVSAPPFAVPPSSEDRIVTVASPLALAAGVKVSVPLAATAGPAAKRAAFVLPVTENDTVCALSPGPALMPVAQPATDAAPESSSTVRSAPFVNDGASFTLVTVMSNVWPAEASTPPLAVPPSSLIRTVMVAVPNALAAGVKVSVPLAATAGPAAKRAAFVLPVTENDTVCALSPGPALMPVAQPATDAAPESSSTAWSAPFVNDGASLTAVTAIVNVCSPEVSAPPLAVPPSSVARMVIVADPFALAAGVKVSVPFDATAGPAEKRPPLVLPVT